MNQSKFNNIQGSIWQLGKRHSETLTDRKIYLVMTALFSFGFYLWMMDPRKDTSISLKDLESNNIRKAGNEDDICTVPISQYENPH
jgi:hypothetical protein